MRPRSFPLPAPVDDERFTIGLAIDIALVLVDHGYPDVRNSGGDVVALQQALMGFLYGPKGGEGR